MDEPDAWSPVATADDLPDRRPIRVGVGDDALFLFRAGDRVLALGDRCSHAGGPLHRGVVNSSPLLPTVTCPVHGSLFRLSDGRVLRGPATAPQPAYDARISGEMVEVRPRAG